MPIIQRQPTGRNKDNRPDNDGIWRKPAPERLPCIGCGQLTSGVLPVVCPTCQDWNARYLRFLARRVALEGSR